MEDCHSLMSNFGLYFTDNYIQKARKNFMDSRSRRNINRLNDELHDVQKIMVQNIDEVLQRGETLNGKNIQQIQRDYYQDVP
jgi:vesicle transport protein SEC22